MNMDKRVAGSAGVILFLGILGISLTAAGTPTFDEGQNVTQNLSIEYVASPDAEWKNGDIQYYGVKTATVSIAEENQTGMVQNVSEVVADQNWKIFTGNDTVEEWSGTETVDNALHTPDGEQEKLSFKRNFSQTFSTTGQYAYVIVLASIDGTHDFENDSWSYDIEKVEEKYYLFEVTQSDLSILG